MLQALSPCRWRVLRRITSTSLQKSTRAGEHRASSHECSQLLTQSTGDPILALQGREKPLLQLIKVPVIKTSIHLSRFLKRSRLASEKRNKKINKIPRQPPVLLPPASLSANVAGRACPTPTDGFAGTRRPPANPPGVVRRRAGKSTTDGGPARSTTNNSQRVCRRPANLSVGTGQADGGIGRQ
ncbi:hypothetical protein KSP39_PZI011401 [Platanthera zijinensis]|uniref:Uncharacterized protein n=1 Tax=Platanthera zijinensis TaxID=2320716 RepID=A0AAP0G5R7_9ASPA